MNSCSNSREVGVSKGHEKPASGNQKKLSTKTSMLIDFCSMYLNKDNAGEHVKVANERRVVPHLPNLNNKEMQRRKANVNPRNKLMVTFNRQNASAQNYLNSAARRNSNNLTKLHEFENNLLVKDVPSTQMDLKEQTFIHAYDKIVKRREVAIPSKHRDKSDNHSMPSKGFVSSAKKKSILYHLAREVLPDLV
uniref:Uncharacterized protein n=1 Tax=Euplotes harpa TaxID=151035 RepID=A0A7S3JF45_9SPIT|mmetsp:Transcript_36728/g.42248  ORF Transcript_36728/g.42248 Transcript_36728/m.42248 type:complete len:193 (+) Transcript_36728:100-678(+)